MFADEVLRATDAQSNLEARLTIEHGSDGGASAVAVELTNQSVDNDVVLKVSPEPSAFIMLTVADEQGTVLSKPARQFSTEEDQQFERVGIAPAASHQWRTPIAEQMAVRAIPGAELKGRLVVNVVLLFSKIKHDKPSAAADFNTSIVTLYDTNVRFTRAALSEGTGQRPTGCEGSELHRPGQ